MQKWKTVTKTAEERVVEETVCNFCGKTMEPAFEGYPPDCIQIRKRWGYASGKDMTQQSADICEPCWDELCGKMKVPVTEFDTQDPWCAGFDESYNEDALSEDLD